MANQYYDVRVDVAKSDVFDSGLRFTQGDSKVIFLRIAVMNNGAKFDASNTTPSVNFVKPDGTYVVGTPVESDDVWVYQFVGNELQAAGKVLCDIKFTYSSGRISSGKFAFFVEKDTTIPGAAASQNYIIPMDQALAEMMNYKNLGKSVAEAAEESASAAADSAAAAKESEESAAAIVGIGIATTTTAGIVKPDGTSITVDNDGTIHSQGGAAQVQSDWNQADADEPDYIKNKPTIPAAQIQSDWNQSDTSAKDFIKNKPTIPAAQIQSDWSQSNASAKDYIKNKPPIPAAAKNGQLTIQQNGTNVQTFTADQDSNVVANITTDIWSSSAQVDSNNQVTFDNLDNSYGYDLYCDDKLIGVTAMAKTSGTNTGIKLVFTVTGAAQGDTCYLRILR